MTRELLDALLSAVEPTDPAWARLVRLVCRATDAIKLSNSPPSPDGSKWTVEGLADLAQEFWATGRADKVILAAKHDQHLRALVNTEVRNVAIAGLRASGRAALHDRLTDVLAKGNFVKEGPFWRLEDHEPGSTYQGGRRELLEAAFEIEVERLYVKESSKRESSFASREQFEAMLTAVLERAGGAVSMADLREVAQRWLNLHPPYSTVVIDSDFASGNEPVGIGADVAEHVDRIWDRLSDDGRELLLYMDPKMNTSRDTAAVVGYGHDKVARVIKATREILFEELQDLPRDEQIAIVRRLKDRQRQLLLDQTELADGALE